ncbi:MAG: hypothetical protein HGB04_01310 [Chlorobiaceae bacterium]|nr:hypothetical protein [Chlorobiaceae bacterium]
MKNSTWWMLLPVPVVLAVSGVLYVLFPERIMADRTMLASVVLVSLSAGAIAYNLVTVIGKSGNSGVIGSIGIGTIMSALVLLAASSGLGMAIAGIGKGAMALNIVTLAGFLATFVVVQATASTNSGSGVKRDARSSHAIWADRLDTIGRSCGMPQLKTRLLKLAGETRCLTPDQGMAAAEVNQRVTGVLDTVAEAVRQSNEQVATLQLKRLRNLFAERESELANLRRNA